VTTAESGKPAPSVFDSVNISGVTPSRSQANIRPVRPTPVCGLVDDQQHAALGAFLLQRRHVARGQFENAARREDRLGDEGGEAAVRLPIDEIEGVVEFGPPIGDAIAFESRPIGRRRGNGERADRRRPRPLAARAIVAAAAPPSCRARIG